jgi:tetratricopeptide (TPR) repeat protein
MATRRQICVVIALALLPLLSARAAEQWIRLRSAHFELITDAGDRHGPGLLLHLEELRRLFIAQVALPENESRPAVRIIGFKSPSEFAAYRLIEHTDAYYVGAPGHDIIVTSLTGPVDFRTASHEYTHVMANHRGLHLPAWLSEGLAEVFSMVRWQAGQAVLGDMNPARMSALLRSSWIPLGEITTTSGRYRSRDASAMFYAESWALTHMLMFSPAYSPRFDTLLLRCAGSAPTPAILGEIYGKPLPAMESDLHDWIARRTPPPVKTPIGSAPIAVVNIVSKAEMLTASEAQLALAELYFAAGRQAQAKAAYLRLETELPSNSDIPAALGRIALAEGHRSEARRYFQHAVASGTKDARVCYEYAHLAEDAGGPDTDVVGALERALVLDPSLDEARFSLAIAHMNAGRYAEAQQQFKAFLKAPERNAFAYYKSLAYTQAELGLRDEAVRSAAEARKHARTPEEIAEASKQAWMAQSEIAVQMAPDGKGQLTRIPLRDAASTSEWNPFIAPGDRMERREGALREVDCSAKEIRLAVIVDGRTLVLSLPDPGRVQVRKSGSRDFELTCGPVQETRVAVEYAISSDEQIAGVLRGIQFLP